MNQAITLVCDLTAIPAAERKQHLRDTTALFPKAQTVRELADGYAFGFANEAGMWMTLANFVEFERLCCPFFTFVLTAEPNHGLLWLQLTASPEAKMMLALLLGDQPSGINLQESFITGGDSRLARAVAEVQSKLAGILST